MPATTLEMKDAGPKLAKVRAEINDLFERRGNWEPADQETFTAKQTEAADLHTLYKQWELIEDEGRRNRSELDELSRAKSPSPYGAGNGNRVARSQKSLGEQFVESHGWKNFLAHGKQGDVTVDFSDFTASELKNGGIPQTEFKDTFSVTSSPVGFAPFVTRTGDIVPFAFRRVMIPDLLPSIPTSQDLIKYMEETLHTANAAATAENAALPESAVQYTERTVNIEDIGTTLPISERMFDDAPFIVGIINQTIGAEVDRAFETQLVSGTGTTPQLQGFLSTAAGTAGVQTQALASDSQITCFVKAMTLIEANAFAHASAVVYHPLDWQDIITLQESGTGRYIFGNPADPGPRTLWGVPVCVTTAMTQNTGLVGDFAVFSYTVNRQGLRMDLGYQNDNFGKRLRTLRAYVRRALVLRRPAAFCKMTGI